MLFYTIVVYWSNKTNENAKIERLRSPRQEVNVSDATSLEAAPSARWDAIVLPPTTANYTFTLRCRGKAERSSQNAFRSVILDIHGNHGYSWIFMDVHCKMINFRLS